MKRYIESVLLTLFAFIVIFTIGCGSNGVKGASHDASALNMTFVSIPGGSFQMGDEVGDLWEGCRPVHTVTVSGFEMGVYEVTNAQYAVFLNEALASGDIEMKDSDAYGKTGEWAGQR
ncbi:MAG: formylglycine-generating enzyme family protein, partial [Candidatus Latescibacterota bacterium]